MRIDVLDKGYVRLVTWLPWNMVELRQAIEDGDLERARELVGEDDLTAVNAARASFQKESDRLDASDERLLNFLTREGHHSPFRHAVLQFEIKAPLMVARQWHKYRIGSTHGPDSIEMPGVPGVLFGAGDDDGFGDPMYARNEASRRYITMEPEFYIPDVWRAAPENKRQGSGGAVSGEESTFHSLRLREMTKLAIQEYELALEQGIAPEQARLFLPAYALYTVWRWTASAQAVAWFLHQRLAHDAQSEIREYAEAVQRLAAHAYPHAMKLFQD